MKIFNCIDELVGNTPLLRLHNVEDYNELEAAIYAKIEFFNPAGSVKDRVAKEMIEAAEKDGRLVEGATIIEPTSGNTGIGIAAICASKGYEAIIVMPDTMSIERRTLMKAYGAELVLTDGQLGMRGAIAEAERLHAKIANSIIAGQFVNASNPNAHYKTTGPEIWNDTDGEIDIFISCIGTGGTITGTAKYLKEKNKNIKVIGVEPANSPYLTKGIAGNHKIQGIGAGFKPDILDLDLVDEIITVDDSDAYWVCRELAEEEGLLAGISSGAALAAAVKIAKSPENKGKNIVVILPDTGERYLSSDVFK
ncbi:MAG: cysteine synthase A [Clostridia bacterium]|nr:cysteine synthase A [Clostridia bacterium]